ncbi:hypothetical protein [Neisseria sp. 83E34]|uniref:hypothetical protein n=1 Tax=Neisseria sp. 83E34 TaxID=1692264 RepID=UPI0006CE67BD|nr:hypothetical protein [Neisseria sp. 83E34]KPN72452.1 membrane protein [Neisseria sp. 83E34]
MKKYLALISAAAFTLTACGGDKQAELEAQVKAQQEQIAQLQAQQDTTVYQLAASAVNETIPAAEQEKGKNGEVVTGTDGQQYMYDPSTGSWLLQSLIGAAAGAFIGSALANKFTKAPANSPTAQQVRTQYAQQYRGKTAQAPNKLTPRQKAAQQANQSAYRQSNNAQNNYQQPRQQRNMGGKPGFGRRR